MLQQLTASSLILYPPCCDNYNICAFDVYIFEKCIKLSALLVLFCSIWIFLALADGLHNLQLCSSLGFEIFSLSFRYEVQIPRYRFPWCVLCQTTQRPHCPHRDAAVRRNCSVCPVRTAQECVHCEVGSTVPTIQKPFYRKKTVVNRFTENQKIH
jgi:hypothetical protein